MYVSLWLLRAVGSQWAMVAKHTRLRYALGFSLCALQATIVPQEAISQRSPPLECGHTGVEHQL